MSDPASGATVTRLFDPDRVTHYAITEDAQLELRALFDAMAAISHIMDTPPGQSAAEIDAKQIAPIFYSFARHGDRLLREMPCHFPASQRKSA